MKLRPKPVEAYCQTEYARQQFIDTDTPGFRD
jgi:hypothetical protein